jgi:hypothetical protein
MNVLEPQRVLRRESGRALAHPIQSAARLAVKLLRLRALGYRAILLLLSLSLPISAQDNSNPSPPDFTEFQIITQRNIFNASRSNRPTPTANRPPTRSSQVDSFTLVGTFGDGEQWIAFFDGTRSELRGRLQLDDSIGDYTVTQISNSGVQLENGTNTVQLRVGTQLRRENDGPWLLAGRGESHRAEDSSSRRQRSTQTSTVSTASAASANTGDTDNEVLRRLRQQREKELQ